MKNTTLLYDTFLEEDSISVSFKYPEKEILSELNGLFSLILANSDLVFLLEVVVTINRELVINAAKANAKRIFFEKNKIDINCDDTTYEETMKLFKKELISNAKSLRDILYENDKYKIKIIIRKEKDGILLKIINNAQMLPKELSRINTRIKKTVKFHDFSQIYTDIYDVSEGAGLGIALTIMLLKNCGIFPHNLKIYTKDNVTISSLLIPFHIQKVDISTKIKEKILTEINILPTFPEHIMEIQKLCSQKDVAINRITEKTKLDPALTSQILKLANSASFYSEHKITDMNTAIVRLGLQNLQNILTVTASYNILSKRYKKFQKIWSHSTAVAFFAKEIAQKYYPNDKALIENSYLAGLLHDIGKIVLLSVEEKRTLEIAKIVKSRKIRNTTLLEEATIGLSHSEIGNLLAQKWNFPEYLEKAIKYHHAPLNCEKEQQDIVYIVYLANFMCGYISKKYNYNFSEETVLFQFQLEEQQDFNFLTKEIFDKYEKQNNNNNYE